jgi:hypothetical protein
LRQRRACTQAKQERPPEDPAHSYTSDQNTAHHNPSRKFYDLLAQNIAEENQIHIVGFGALYDLTLVSLGASDMGSAGAGQT